MNFYKEFCVGVFIIVALLTCAKNAESVNIVFFMGVSSYSHRVPAWPIAEALAEKGHNVTFVTPYPAKNPNPKIHDYVPKPVGELFVNIDSQLDMFEMRKGGVGLASWMFLPFIGGEMCEKIYEDQEYINWVKSMKVDLVFLDALVNDCAYGMIHYWGAKTIVLTTSSPMSYFTNIFGMPDETNWIPCMESYYPADMTFSQRMINALVPLIWHFHRTYFFHPKLEAINREKLGIPDLPPFREIERNISLTFVNTHYAEEFPRSLPPNIVPIGGIAYKKNRKPLPKDLDDFLKKGNGFIYMSFGTVANFSKMDEPIQQAFIGAIRSFPKIQFVWKTSNLSVVKEFPDKNVYVGTWMPQQDILAHPKIKAFITHSGLMGIQEAIYSSVPLISFPIFAEQDYNAERIHRKEIGIRLEITTVTQPQLEDAINRILTDPKYRHNVQVSSKLFSERPQTPLETAMWWTEFVLRHSQEELTALRPLSVTQSWWVRRQLDVWLTIFGLTSVAIFTVLFLLLKLLKRCFSRSNKAENKKKRE